MKHSYFPSQRDDERRMDASEKAKRRGEVAEAWLKVNKLTKENMGEFQDLMKSVDKDLSKFVS